MHNYDVFGIGHALVDLLVEVNDNFLKKLKLTKGHFHLVSRKQAEEILKKLKNLNLKKAPGGSCANAITAISHMGGNTVFCSKVGKDSYGKLYANEMIGSNVNSNIAKHTLSTGFCITLITPDCERTFVVFYGASGKLKKEDISKKMLTSSRFLHVAGYSLIGDIQDAAVHAIKLAKNNNVEISIDLGDPGLVKRNKEFFTHLIKKYADIVFANEEEAVALTGLPADEALHVLGSMSKLAIIKLGKQGSVMKIKNKTIKIDSIYADAVDTTGAGDMYAAGVLYGISNNLSLEEAGKIASFAAAKVVEQMGARLDSSLKDAVNEVL